MGKSKMKIWKKKKKRNRLISYMIGREKEYNRQRVGERSRKRE